MLTKLTLAALIALAQPILVRAAPPPTPIEERGRAIHLFALGALAQGECHLVVDMPRFQAFLEKHGYTWSFFRREENRKLGEEMIVRFLADPETTCEAAKLMLDEGGFLRPTAGARP